MVQAGQASLKLAAAPTCQVLVLLQLRHVLCRQLELHVHHVGTNAQANGQRRAARQEVANLSGKIAILEISVLVNLATPVLTMVTVCVVDTITNTH